MLQAKKVKTISHSDQMKLIHNVTDNPKHKLIVLLMLDCGLRVSETASLQIKNFDFANHEIVVATLKKRSENPVYRSIPMTRRLQIALAEYYVTLKDKSPEAFIFPSWGKRGHIDRRRITRMVKKKSGFKAKSHTLRHTFATKIVNEGNDIRVAQKLLGHAAQRTTEIYLHVDDKQKRQAIKSIDRLGIFEQIKHKMIRRKKIYYLDHFDPITDDAFVARSTELVDLHGLSNRKINTILLGSQGVGKSALLQRLQGEHILRLDDMRAIKQTLANLLTTISNKGKEEIILMLAQESDIQKIMTKSSAVRLIELLKQCCAPQEFTLVIDDLTDITKTGIRTLEKLKNHFHIVCAARRVKIDHATFLTNFERVEIEPLGRAASYILIHQLSQGFTDKIEDYDMYRNHVFDQTQGNPLFIRELINRYRKENYITADAVRDIRHTAALQEYDMSLIVIIGLSSLMVLRYVGGELGGDSGAFRLFGGIFLVFALFARNLFTFTKRRYV